MMTCFILMHRTMNGDRIKVRMKVTEASLWVKCAPGRRKIVILDTYCECQSFARMRILDEDAESIETTIKHHVSPF